MTVRHGVIRNRAVAVAQGGEVGQSFENKRINTAPKGRADAKGTAFAAGIQ